MKINPSQSVGQIAAERREFIPLFEKEGIDYCCEGSRSLKDACYIAGVPLDKIMAALKEIKPESVEWYLAAKDWRKESMASLIEYILQHHHAGCRSQIARITDRIREMSGADQGRHPPLAKLKILFSKMAEEMEEHIHEEEVVVFPFLVQAEKASLKNEPIPQPFKHYSEFSHPLRILQWEYGLMGREWREIHELTHHFQAPPGEEAYWESLYTSLKEMEKDAREHVHLENNILLSRAIQMGLLNGSQT